MGLFLFISLATIVVCVITGTPYSNPTQQNTFGTEFVFVFPLYTVRNNTLVTKDEKVFFYALVSNQENKDNKVTFFLPNNTILNETVLNPNSSIETQFDTTEFPVLFNSTVINANSSYDISLVAGVAFDGMGDSFLVLPTKVLGTEYVITTDDPSKTGMKNEIVIAAVARNYTTIWFPICNGSYNSITIKYPETFPLTCSEDMSGHTIKSQAPIAVFAAIIGVEQPQTIFGVEMLLPVNYWGSQFLLSNLDIDDDDNDDKPYSVFKIVASFNNTEISIDCVPNRTLNAGDVAIYSWTSQFPVYVNTTRPVSIFQMPSNHWSFFIQLPSLDKYLSTPMYFPLIFVSSNVFNYASLTQIKINLTIDDDGVYDGRSTSDFDVLSYCNVPQNQVVLSNLQFHSGTKSFSSSVNPINNNQGAYTMIQYGKFTSEVLYSHVSAMSFDGWPGKGKISETFCHMEKSSTPVSTTTSLSIVTTTSSNISWILIELANQTVNNVSDVDYVLTILNQTLNDAGDTLSVNDIHLVAQIMCRCSSIPNLDDHDFYLYLDCYNQVLNQMSDRLREAQFLYSSSLNYLTCVQQLASNLANTTFNYNSGNVAMAVLETNCSDVTNPTQDYMAIVQYANNTVILKEQQGFFDPSSTDTSITAFAILPYSAICQGVSTSSASRRNDFVIYRNQKLFGSLNTNSSVNNDPDHDGDNDKNCTIQQDPQVSYVITVKILTNETSFDNLVQPVSYGFSVHNFTNSLHAKTVCSYWWNNWYTSGCTLTSTSEDGNLYMCQCSHLTDFSLIVVSLFYLLTYMITFHVAIREKIAYATYTIGLFVTITLTILRNYSQVLKINVFRSWFSSTSIKSVIGDTLMVALFLFYILFAMFSDSETLELSSYGCKVAGAVLYTVLLSTLCFATFAGLTFFKVYYIVFNHRCLNFLTSKLFIVIISIALPCLLTIILWFAYDSSFFQRNDGFCWIRPTDVAFAVVIPTTVMIIGDIVLSGLLIKGFFFSGSKAIQTVRGRRKIIIKKIIVLLTVQVVLALPWVLQYFTIGSPTVTVFHYLFTLTNGSQGIWLTIIYLYSFVKSIKVAKKNEKSTERTEVRSTRSTFYTNWTKSSSKRNSTDPTATSNGHVSNVVINGTTLPRWSNPEVVTNGTKPVLRRISNDSLLNA